MFKKILAYGENEKKSMYISILQCIFSVAFSIVPYFMIYLLISRLVDDQPFTVSYVGIIAAIITVSLILESILYVTGLGNSHVFAFRVLEEIRRSLQEKLEQLPIGYVEDKGKGTMKKVFVDDIDSMETLLAHAIPEGIANLTISIFVIISMLLIDIRLGLLALVTIPIALVAFFYMFKIGKSKMADYFTAGQHMNNTIIEYINGMEVVKVFNQEGQYFGKFKESILNYRDKTLAWYKACWPSMSVYTIMFSSTALVMLPVGSYLVLSQSAELSQLVLTFCLASSLGIPLLRLISFVPALMQINYKIEVLESVMEEEPIKTGTSEFTGANYDVTFNNISFNYDDEVVVNNLTLTAKEGETTALVGESGSGKSTLAKLLVHYYDVGTGSITIGGQDISELSLKTLGNLVSYVSQDVYLFKQSILENIRIGNPRATDEEVMEVAQRAQCVSIFENLSEGIHSIVGTRGDKLSGGERQRICIARALLKDSPIVLLDEAMAYIDAENETLINQALTELSEGKTIITIAHRLMNIMDSEKIYVLEKGNIESEGSHSDLVVSSSIYQKLWNAAIKSENWQPKGGELQ